MKRRWRLLTGLGLLLFVGASLLHPAVHWRLIGWARAESFYNGRPTSWWAGRFVAYHDRYLDPTGNTGHWTEYLRGQLIGPPQGSEADFLGLVPEETALPLLRELLGHENPVVRLLAAALLAQQAPRDAVPLLLAARHDSDIRVRGYVAAALTRVDPEAATKAGLVDP